MKTVDVYEWELLSLWREAVEAVNAEQVTSINVQFVDEAHKLIICEREYLLNKNSRVIIIGAGKASAQMATGVEKALRNSPWFDQLSGWVNVPANTIELTSKQEKVTGKSNLPEYSAAGSTYKLEKIILHPGREGGSNFPRPEGVLGTKKMLKLLATMTDDDLAIILISGGGSALLPYPIPEITLDQKTWITKHLSQSGASIQELNAVRICLSQVKGGKLLTHIPHGRAVCLIISDVIGDPIGLIASGPTVASDVTPVDALQILLKYPQLHPDYQTILEIIAQQRAEPTFNQANKSPLQSRCDNFIIANNTRALERACLIGKTKYDYQQIVCNRKPFSGDATRHAREVAHKLRSWQQSHIDNDCLYLAGGETTVNLSATVNHGKGGRNQEVVLALLCEFWETGLEGIYFLSGGTDGEDGPTDAAGAFIHQGVWKRAKQLNQNPHDYLARHDAYNFFKPLDALLITGPTHTNVMDIEVGIVTQKNTLVHL